MAVLGQALSLGLSPGWPHLTHWPASKWPVTARWLLKLCIRSRTQIKNSSSKLLIRRNLLKQIWTAQQQSACTCAKMPLAVNVNSPLGEKGRIRNIMNYTGTDAFNSLSFWVQHLEIRERISFCIFKLLWFSRGSSSSSSQQGSHQIFWSVSLPGIMFWATQIDIRNWKSVVGDSLWTSQKQ